MIEAKQTDLKVLTVHNNKLFKGHARIFFIEQAGGVYSLQGSITKESLHQLPEMAEKAVEMLK